MPEGEARAFVHGLPAPAQGHFARHDAAHAGAADAVDGDPELGDGTDDADVPEPPRAAPTQNQAHRTPGQPAGQATRVGAVVAAKMVVTSQRPLLEPARGPGGLPSRLVQQDQLARPEELRRDRPFDSEGRGSASARATTSIKSAWVRMISFHSGSSALPTSST